MDDWWECDRLDELVDRILRAGLQPNLKPWADFVLELKAKFFNLQNPGRAHEVGRHYDIGNDLYRVMLDRRMIYRIQASGHDVGRGPGSQARSGLQKIDVGTQIAAAAEGRFLIEDLHNFSPDYDRTLLHWWRNFETHWHSLKDRYDERFYRMWRYYLLTFAGAFRARHNQLWQIVMSPKGTSGRYHAPR